MCLVLIIDFFCKNCGNSDEILEMFEGQCLVLIDIPP